MSAEQKYSITEFFENAKARDLAKIIIRIINTQDFDIDEAKSFYKHVRDFHFPKFSDILDNNKQLFFYQQH